jgi:hypothetical protein
VHLGPLADNGGPTETHALLPESLGVDAVTEGCPTTDQRGVSRPLGARCDVGAYEIDPGLPAPPVPLEGAGLPTMVTPGMDLPRASMAEDSLCWTGPGSVYEVVSSVLAGTSVQLIGRDLQGGWWVIDAPRYPGVACWVPRQRIDVPPTLDVDGLSIFAIPPIPTPTERPQAASGCLIYDDSTPNNPTDTVCVPRACTPNDQPGGSCTP